ncbi:hypothetical protein GWK47_048872 [Chionoecetes opilio]|uniref:Uncharacterized protein n=1 Tax=Chionoecetes opilio TaxID=41210 RepID=A0A8J5CTU8_CHIOP|nr:hypothetical protein GWK47_048872 [Chionoecetes opilio]
MLLKSRASFEAEKGEFLKEQFLQDLPITLETALTCGGHDSSGSLSSGSIGEMFGSPKYTVAIPNITLPTGNITHVQGAAVVLGSPRLPKPPSDSYKGRGSSRRL